MLCGVLCPLNASAEGGNLIAFYREPLIFTVTADADRPSEPPVSEETAASPEGSPENTPNKRRRPAGNIIRTTRFMVDVLHADIARDNSNDAELIASLSGYNGVLYWYQKPRRLQSDFSGPFPNADLVFLNTKGTILHILPYSRILAAQDETTATEAEEDSTKPAIPLPKQAFKAMLLLAPGTIEEAALATGMTAKGPRF